MKRVHTLLELIAMQEAAERMCGNSIIWVSDFRTHLGMGELSGGWDDVPEDDSWEQSEGAAHWTPEGESL